MKITPDKWKHLYVGIALGVVLQALGWWLFPSSVLTVSIIVFIIVFAVSFGFEQFSQVSGYGHCDWMDAVFSLIGGLIGMGVILFFQMS